MSLSSLISTLPKSQVTLPISGIKVEYRPFIVKEEKVLLMAAESKDEKTMYNAIKNIVQACTDGKLDITKLPTADVEFMFLQLRSDSIGETVKPHIKCSECETPNQVEVKLKEIKPESQEQKDKKVHLVGDIYVIMKHPTLADIQKVDSKTDEQMERALYMIVKCIDKVISGETIFNTEEIDVEEVKTFVENLTQPQFAKLLEFVQGMPTMQKRVEFACKKCGHQNDIVLRVLASFFS
jgi:hypothetical protein